VIDTNVIVSAMLQWDSVPGKVVQQALVGRILPVLSEKILTEYYQVLRRPKFHFNEEDIKIFFEGFCQQAEFVHTDNESFILVDAKDAVFYVAARVPVKKDRRVYLVTGNTRHFPREPQILTPREMLDVLTGPEPESIFLEQI
jgi:putative PIN family toxin of toxin-antitoxin system